MRGVLSVLVFAALAGCTDDSGSLSIEEGLKCASEAFKGHRGAFSLGENAIAYLYDSPNGPARVMVVFDEKRRPVAQTCQDVLRERPTWQPSSADGRRTCDKGLRRVWSEAAGRERQGRRNEHDRSVAERRSLHRDLVYWASQVAACVIGAEGVNVLERFLDLLHPFRD